MTRTVLLAPWIAGICLAATAVSSCHAATEPGGSVRATETSEPQVSAMKIRIVIDGKTIPATLADNATSRDFASLLPLTLTLEDYASTEKISDLPRKLSTQGAPAGSDPSIGDIAYYAPWGNLAIFYRDFHYSRGLVRLGRIDPGVEALSRPGPLRVTIERMEIQR